MAWRHTKIMSPAEALAKRGLLYGSETKETKGPKETPKGANRTRKQKINFLKAAEEMRRARRMLLAKVNG